MSTSFFLCRSAFVLDWLEVGDAEGCDFTGGELLDDIILLSCEEPGETLEACDDTKVLGLAGVVRSFEPVPHDLGRSEPPQLIQVF